MSAAVHHHHRLHHHRHKIMIRKIITYFLILAVILPVFVAVIPLGTRVSMAALTEEEKKTVEDIAKKDELSNLSKDMFKKAGLLAGSNTDKNSNNGKLYDPCEWHWYSWYVRGISECISFTVVNFLYDWVLTSAVWIAGLAGNLFNASIQFSLTGKVFDTEDVKGQDGKILHKGNVMIRDGWTLVRDLLNLVFIFILLYAAISTILQYGNFQVKKILPGIIVAALLINFSLMITKMVIDGSHVFAWEFYNKIDVTNEEMLGKGERYANLDSDVTARKEIYGNFEKKNLANVFIAGFNPQTLLTGSDKKGEDGKPTPPLWKTAVDEALKKGESISGLWWQMGLIILLESALALFAGFILLAGTIMFVVRVVVLWLVMIFSPLAFLGMILPNMKKYSDMWWGHLIGQSFFAPAFLFMFMLVTKFINSNFIDSILTTSGNSDSFIVLGINGGAIALTFFHFIVVGGLMFGCLIVAREIGGKTASASIGWAHSIKGLALGGLKGGARMSYGGLKGAARQGYAPLAEDYATGKGTMGKVGNWMRKNSLLGGVTTRKAADIAAESRRITEEKQKKYGKYTADEMKNLQSGWFDKIARPIETAARVAASAEKGDTQGISPGLIEKAISWQKKIDTGKKSGAIERSAPGLVSGDIDAMRKEELTKKFKEADSIEYARIEKDVREKNPRKYVNDNKAFQKDVQEEIKTVITTMNNAAGNLYRDADDFIDEKLNEEFMLEDPGEFTKIATEAMNKISVASERDKYIQDSVNRRTADNRARVVILKKATAADIEKNGHSLFVDASMAKHLNTGSAKKILDMGGDLNEKMFEGLVNLAESLRLVAGGPIDTAMAIEKIAKDLQKVGNYPLAGWVKKQGKIMVESYGKDNKNWT